MSIVYTACTACLPPCSQHPGDGWPPREPWRGPPRGPPGQESGPRYVHHAPNRGDHGRGGQWQPRQRGGMKRGGPPQHRQSKVTGNAKLKIPL